MKHTPGPWYYTPNPSLEDKEYFIQQSEVNEDNYIGVVEFETNARLIADAPIMFEYIEYVQAKIDIEEIPFTYEQWKQAEIDLRDE